jgi:hypothetical protein
VKICVSRSIVPITLILTLVYRDGFYGLVAIAFRSSCPMRTHSVSDMTKIVPSPRRSALPVVADSAIASTILST